MLCRAIFREQSEHVFSVHVLEAGGVGGVSSRQDFGELHFVQWMWLLGDATAPHFEPQSQNLAMQSCVGSRGSIQGASVAPGLSSLLSSSARSDLDAAPATYASSTGRRSWYGEELLVWWWIRSLQGDLARSSSVDVVESVVEHVVCEIARFVHQPSSDDLAKVFSWTMIVCHDVNGFATLAGGADAPIHVCRDHSLLWLLVCVFCVGVTGFRRSYADNFGVVARGVESTSVHLANVIAGREGQDRMSMASPLTVGVSRHPHVAVVRPRGLLEFVRWLGQSPTRRRISGMVMEFVGGRESFLA